MLTRIRVLFLCTANSARSQIAEALLARKGGNRFLVASAGDRPAARVHPQAVAALREIGIDWSGRRPKGLDAVAGEAWDLIITTCDRVRETCPAFPGRPVYAHWGVPDPAEAGHAQAFKDAVHLLAWRIDLMLALRPDVFDHLIAEQRLNAIGRAHPDAADVP